MKILKNMPFLLLGVALSILLLFPYLSFTIKSTLYAFSLTIQSGIIFLLPFIIFGLIFRAAVNIALQSTFLILFMIVGVCLSNFISTLISREMGALLYRFDVSLVLPSVNAALQPLWRFELPSLIPNSYALLLGLLLGIIGTFTKPALTNRWSLKIEKGVQKILYLFVYCIPLFIAGFIVKLQEEGVMITLLKDYTLIFLVVAVAVYSYLLLTYLFITHFKIKDWIHALHNMLPAAITGFCTMSSAAAMPFTLLGVEKNSKNSLFAKSMVPGTVNIHLVGDCFAIPIFAFAILKTYGLDEPSFFQYSIFAFYFVLAKFSVAAIPGGGILVMLPILQSYLGFNAEMLSLMTTLYILFDPVTTGANVLGNGSFALIMNKLADKMRFSKVIKAQTQAQEQ